MYTPTNEETKMIRAIKMLIPPITVWRKVGATRVYFNLRDGLDYVRAWKARETEVYDFMNQHFGIVYDIGCNIGLYSVVSAQAGNAVFCYDLSEDACDLLKKTADKSDLQISVFNKAITVVSRRHEPVKNSHPENRVLDDTDSGCYSLGLSYLMNCVTPNLIKMDIEGGESEFMDSTVFKHWVLDNNIQLLIERHSSIEYWPDVYQRKLSKTHTLYNYKSAERQKEGGEQNI